MILFRRVRWMNLLSTGNAFTEIDLLAAPTTLIVGSNGAGKSTILDALTFGLFGKPFRRINKPQLINSITERGLLVEIEFAIGRDEYIVRRGAKPSLFEIVKNGETVDQSADSRDHQSYLERSILGLNYRSFCQVVVLGSATFQPFMQLTASQRREVIDDILDLHVFTVMSTLARGRLDDASAELARLSAEIKHVSSRLDHETSRSARVDGSMESMVAAKRAAIDETRLAISSVRDEYESVVGRLTDLRGTLYDRADVERRASELTLYGTKIRTQVEAINRDAKFFSEHDSCPTCRQTISEELRESMTRAAVGRVGDLEAGYELIKSTLVGISARLDEIHGTDLSISALETELALLGSRATMLANQLTIIRGELTSLSSAAMMVRDESEVDRLKSELATLRDAAETTAKRVDLLKLVQSSLRDDGLKARVISRYVPVINELVCRYLSSMDFFVSFELDENFVETIKSRHRDSFSYESFSEGEKQRIDLALMFTWRAIARSRNSVATNLLIMDEVFDSSLDSSVVEHVMALIQEAASDSNVFVISHRENLSERFSRVIRFGKHRNFSRIEDEA
jgi:DNA repair exonuclease SbcCD ATPase subunit